MSTAESRLKVLMISPQYRPLVGGYERAAERLCTELVKRGHRVMVITDRQRREWLPHEVCEGTEVRRLWCVFRPRLHISTAFISYSLFLLWYGRRFDVWHVHQYGAHAVLAIVLGRLLGRPVVLKVTSSAGDGLAKAISAGRFSRLSAHWHKAVTAVAALTRETACEAEAFGIPQERVHVLGNGIDTLTFAPLPKSARTNRKLLLGLGVSSVALFVGRLSSEKNPEGLLKAWAMARKGLTGDWKLVLVGEGPLRPSIERYIAGRLLPGDVLMVGHQDNIAQWMGAADIYVLPSENEGLSNTLLEAMACGLPVVATRVSGIPELVEESGSGLAVAVGDMEALAQALVRLGEDSELRTAMGARARQTVVDRFAINNVAAGYELLYRSLIRENTT